jgi:hypothetical protein
VLLGTISASVAQEPDAKGVLKAMSDYLASQTTLSFQFDSSIEVLTTDLEKIQFDSSSEVELKRPDKMRIARLGGYADVELLFNGVSLVIHDRHNKKYVEVSAQGTIDTLFDKLRNDLGIEAPGGDLLVSDVFGALSADVLSAKLVGEGVIGGITCHHLAFRNADTDWQLWVRTGDAPVPCKMVITSKTVAAAPQYTVEVRDWQSNPSVAETAFEFKANGSATKVELEAFSGLDEVPPGAAIEGGQQ